MNRLVLLIVSLIAATEAADYYSCLWIKNPDVDCTLFPVEETCGTDGQTYKNKCYLSKSHCLDDRIGFKHHGACDASYTGTTLDPIKGAAVMQSILCAYLANRNCGNTYEPTCGSDGRSYPNFCEYEKSKCTHKDLHVAHFGDCAS